MHKTEDFLQIISKSLAKGSHRRALKIFYVSTHHSIEPTHMNFEKFQSPTHQITELTDRSTMKFSKSPHTISQRPHTRILWKSSKSQPIPVQTPHRETLKILKVSTHHNTDPTPHDMGLFLIFHHQVSSTVTPQENESWKSMLDNNITFEELNLIDFDFNSVSEVRVRF